MSEATITYHDLIESFDKIKQPKTTQWVMHRRPFRLIVRGKGTLSMKARRWLAHKRESIDL